MKKSNNNLDKFVINYNGNKFLETNKYLKGRINNIEEYDIIAEGCCGIFGFTRSLFSGELFEKLKNSDKVPEIWLNDINNDLIDFFKVFQQEDGGEEFLLKIKTFVNDNFADDAACSAYMREQNRQGELNLFLKPLTVSNIACACFSV
jgi:site-specific DNA-adenine methylase